jgi:LPS export ABC transporter protein LptC
MCLKRYVIFLVLPFFLACSFDYGENEADDTEDLPDIVMENVEYVRVRNGNPLARFTAENVERYEERHTMELRNFTFEQFETHGEELNAEGTAGAASVSLDSGDVQLRGGIRIEVKTEDITIETDRLDWKDKERILSVGENERVDMKRSDGTDFFGLGFTANIRERTWGFASGIQGSYIWEDDDDEPEPVESADTESGDTATDAASPETDAVADESDMELPL